MALQAYDDHEDDSRSENDDMSEDDDMHDDDEEGSPSLESDHDHGESGDEEDEELDDDDDDEDDHGSSDDSLSDRAFDQIDGEGDLDADAEVWSPCLPCSHIQFLFVSPRHSVVH